MEDLWNELGPSGLTVIGIGVDEPEAVCRGWIERFGLTYLVLADPEEDVWNLFGMGYVPHNAVLDCEMTVLYTNYGYEETEIRSHISDALTHVTSVEHNPAGDTENTSDPIHITATFSEEVSFPTGYPALLWNNDGGESFTAIVMEPVSRNREYFADIPAQHEADVYYYIDLRNEDKCYRVIPPGAPENLYHFYVGADVIPPDIQHDFQNQYPVVLLPFQTQAYVTDNLDVASVSVEYRINEGNFSIESMTYSDDHYTWTCPVSLTIDDVIEYRIIATDTANTPNTAYAPESGYYQTTIVEKLIPIIIDLDGAANSGVVIHDALTALDVSSDYVTEMPSNLFSRQAVFVCLGVYGSNNHVLTSAEGQILATYLDNGGNLYMEGGDTWYYDPQTDVHPYFHIHATSDGSNDAGTILGEEGTFTSGMTFQYSSASAFNKWIDRLTPQDQAFPLLKNESPNYNVCIGYGDETYRTIGSSIKFGGLASSMRTDPIQLMRQYLGYFGVIDVPPTPTPPPTSTPTSPPTSTPTSPPTHTPTPPPKPTLPPTPTPSPTQRESGIKLFLSQSVFHAGDRFKLDAQVINSGGPIDVQEFIVLDIFGTAFYYWPSWTLDIDYKERYLTEGFNEIESIFDFIWPTVDGSASDIRFWAALLNAENGDLFGDYDMVSWSYE